MLLSDRAYPRFKVTFGGNDATRPPMEIDAEQFVAVKGFKAKGKRLTTYALDTINELEPTRRPEPESEAPVATEEPEDLDPDKDKTPGDILDELTGQMKLF